MDWSKLKIRCSGISKALANSRSNPSITEIQAEKLAKLEARSVLTDNMKMEMADLIIKRENCKKIILSDTCIAYLMEMYAWETEQMVSMSRETMDAWQVKKGILQEEQARILLSAVDGVEYKIHKERIVNDYLSGEIDTYLGDTVMEATNITDIKNASDYPIFLKKINMGLETSQRQQVQGYCDITGAKEGYIANCLVDAPDEIIEDMKWKIAKKMNAVTIESPEFLEEWKTFERSMRFSHIHPYKRVFKIKVDPFSYFERNIVYDRVKVCREWMCEFDEKYQMLNK